MNQILKLTILVSLALLIFGCAPSAPSIPEGEITFTRWDGKKFTGTAYGEGETAIILANMSTGGQSQWDPFVDAVDKQKFTVITFGYLQLFPDDYAGASQEVDVIFTKLKEVGYKRVICMGASLGVTACSAIARAPELIGIVMISGPNNGLDLDGSYPKLFIAGETDQWSIDTKRDYDQAAEPKTLTIYPETGSHGTDLFHSPRGDEFLKTLLDFVNNIR